MKKRTMEKLFVTRLKTSILVNFNLSVLPVFKFVILVFEQKQPNSSSFTQQIKKTLCASFWLVLLKRKVSKEQEKLQNWM